MTTSVRRPNRRALWLVIVGVAALAVVVGGGLWLAGSVPDPATAARLTQEAHQLAQKGQINQALARLAEAKRADPPSPGPYLATADLLERSAHNREAFQELTAARRLAPHEPAVILPLLRELPPSYPAADAESLAREAVRQMPQSGEAHYMLARAIVAGGYPQRYPEALQEFDVAQRLLPESAVPPTDMGRLLARMGDDRRAAEELALAGRLLDRQPVHGQVPIPALDEWFKQRRAAAFWLAQVERRLGRRSEEQAAQKEAANLSEAASELRSIKDRARAVPPDPAALARLHSIATRGVDAWRW